MMTRLMQRSLRQSQHQNEAKGIPNDNNNRHESQFPLSYLASGGVHGVTGKSALQHIGSLEMSDGGLSSSLDESEDG